MFCHTASSFYHKICKNYTQILRTKIYNVYCLGYYYLVKFTSVLSKKLYFAVELCYFLGNFGEI